MSNMTPTKIVPTAMSVRFGLILPISEKYWTDKNVNDKPSMQKMTDGIP